MLAEQMGECYWSHLFALDIDALNLGGDHADERDILIDKNTSTDQMFTEPPHLVTTQVLVSKRELDVVSRVTILVYLNTFVSKRRRCSTTEPVVYLGRRDFGVVFHAECVGDIFG